MHIAILMLLTGAGTIGLLFLIEHVFSRDDQQHPNLAAKTGRGHR